MNERIKELEKQSVFYNEDEEIWELDHKKFAELIVRECARLADDPDVDMLRTGRAIREHFGVEQ